MRFSKKEAVKKGRGRDERSRPGRGEKIKSNQFAPRGKPSDQRSVTKEKRIGRADEILYRGKELQEHRAHKAPENENKITTEMTSRRLPALK